MQEIINSTPVIYTIPLYKFLLALLGSGIVGAPVLILGIETMTDNLKGSLSLFLLFLGFWIVLGSFALTFNSASLIINWIT